MRRQRKRNKLARKIGEDVVWSQRWHGGKHGGANHREVYHFRTYYTSVFCYSLRHMIQKILLALISMDDYMVEETVGNRETMFTVQLQNLA